MAPSREERAHGHRRCIALWLLVCCYVIPFLGILVLLLVTPTPINKYGSDYVCGGTPPRIAGADRGPTYARSSPPIQEPMCLRVEGAEGDVDVPARTITLCLKAGTGPDSDSYGATPIYCGGDYDSRDGDEEGGPADAVSPVPSVMVLWWDCDDRDENSHCREGAWRIGRDHGAGVGRDEVFEFPTYNTSRPEVPVDYHHNNNKDNDEGDDKDKKGAREFPNRDRDRDRDRDGAWRRHRHDSNSAKNHNNTKDLQVGGDWMDVSVSLTVSRCESYSEAAAAATVIPPQCYANAPVPKYMDNLWLFLLGWVLVFFYLPGLLFCALMLWRCLQWLRWLFRRNVWYGIILIFHLLCFIDLLNCIEVVPFWHASVITAYFWLIALWVPALWIGSLVRLWYYRMVGMMIDATVCSKRRIQSGTRGGQPIYEHHLLLNYEVPMPTGSCSGSRCHHVLQKVGGWFTKKDEEEEEGEKETACHGHGHVHGLERVEKEFQVRTRTFNSVVCHGTLQVLVLPARPGSARPVSEMKLDQCGWSVSEMKLDQCGWWDVLIYLVFVAITTGISIPGILLPYLALTDPHICDGNYWHVRVAYVLSTLLAIPSLMFVSYLHQKENPTNTSSAPRQDAEQEMSVLTGESSLTAPTSATDCDDSVTGCDCDCDCDDSAHYPLGRKPCGKQHRLEEDLNIKI